MSNWSCLLLLACIFNIEQAVSADKKILRKCCPFNMVLDLTRSCVPYSKKIIFFSDVKIYDKGQNPNKTGQTASELFQFKVDPQFEHEQRLNNESYASYLYKSFSSPKTFLHEDGSLTLKIGEISRKSDARNFCIEYLLVKRGDPPKKYRLPWIFFKTDQDHNPLHLNVQTAALVISAFCMLLVLLVYGTLPELRTLGGLVLMACVTSLMSAFLLQAIFQNLQREGLDHTEGVCKGFAFTKQFMYLATFFWMNVMSFDIWRIFRGFAECQPKNRRGDKFRFLMYSLYGWGAPALLTAVIVTINELDLKYGLSTWMTTPQITREVCYFQGLLPTYLGLYCKPSSVKANLYYLHIPMLVLLLSNCVLFAHTAHCIRSLQRDKAMLEYSRKSSHRKNQFRFGLYLKLSLVMGLNWIMEVVGAHVPLFQSFYVAEVYNLLSGVSIFIIFVCKPKIWRLLNKRFSKPDLKSRPSRSSKTLFIRSYSSSDSELSTDDTQFKTSVCIDPTGPNSP